MERRKFSSTMSEISKEKIVSVLKQVVDVETGMDVVTLGLISSITIREGGKIGFLITVAPQDSQKKSYLREACEAAVKAIPGVSSATVVMTAQKSGADSLNPHQQAHVAKGGDTARTHAQWNLTPLPGVKKIIAIASGKGGVGKSTTTVNLAHALTALGKNVAILDADIYGPSIPRMMGLSGQPSVKEGKMQPLVSGGIGCMSMGFITGDEAAILRGPMITKTLQQLLRMVEWGELDILLVDMPPGTGDVHISMVQQVPLSGAIIVTTPQEVALLDARKCAKMFVKVGVPLLGVIENMSYFAEPSTGAKHYLFGKGGGKKLADEFKAPLLGEVPLVAAIGEAADSGKNVLAALPAECATPYQTIAQTLQG